MFLTHSRRAGAGGFHSQRSCREGGVRPQSNYYEYETAPPRRPGKLSHYHWRTNNIALFIHSLKKHGPSLDPRMAGKWNSYCFSFYVLISNFWSQGESGVNFGEVQCGHSNLKKHHSTDVFYAFRTRDFVFFIIQNTP